MSNASTYGPTSHGNAVPEQHTRTLTAIRQRREVPPSSTPGGSIPPMIAEGQYAGWTKARFDLLRRSVDTVFALLADPRSDAEGWRTAIAAEVALWHALADTGSVPVPSRFAEVHRRGIALVDTLTDAGDALNDAIANRDTDRLARAMAMLDGAEKQARAVFAAAYRIMDDGG